MSESDVPILANDVNPVEVVLYLLLAAELSHLNHSLSGIRQDDPAFADDPAFSGLLKYLGMDPTPHRALLALLNDVDADASAYLRRTTDQLDEDRKHILLELRARPLRVGLRYQAVPAEIPAVIIWDGGDAEELAYLGSDYCGEEAALSTPWGAHVRNALKFEFTYTPLLSVYAPTTDLCRAWARIVKGVLLRARTALAEVYRWSDQRVSLTGAEPDARLSTAEATVFRSDLTFRCTAPETFYTTEDAPRIDEVSLVLAGAVSHVGAATLGPDPLEEVVP